MTIELFNKLVLLWIALAIAVFPLSLKIAAPYGRHTRRGWGPLIDNKLGWILMELPTLILVPVFFFIGDAEKTIPVFIFFGLYIFHYINRVFVFPIRIKTKGKKIPLSIVGFAFIFNLVNGSILGYFLGFTHGGYTMEWLWDPRFLIGFLLFWAGLFINWKHDSILISLRKKGDSGYRIPFGGLFKFVSCPNHLGEIVEWLGYAVMIWALPAWSFAIWTAANLIPRTLSHHRWYKEHFDDYPKNRKAVIPYLI